MKFKRLPIYFFLSLTSGGVLHAEEQRHESAHEHGRASLDLAQEGQQINLHLESPAMNLVGFEHMPSSDADRQMVERTLAKLRVGDQIFYFNEQAECRLMEANVSTSLAGGSASVSVEHDAAEKDHEHDASEKDHKHDASEEDHESHADIEADYRFECANPDQLGRISLDLFRLFPATQELFVQFITDKRQGGTELTATNSELEL